MTKIIITSIVVIILGYIALMYAPTCDTSSGLIRMKTQNCECLGVVYDMTPRGPADDGPSGNQCFGIVTKVTYSE